MNCRGDGVDFRVSNLKEDDVEVMESPLAEQRCEQIEGVPDGGMRSQERVRGVCAMWGMRVKARYVLMLCHWSSQRTCACYRRSGRAMTVEMGA